MSNAQTNVVGYYNGNKWPIQLVISKLNLTMILQPGEYILDREKRKINDPFFETYKQLSREVSDNAVPIITVPQIAALTPQQTVALAQSSPVRGTTKFGMNAKGIRQPEMPKSIPSSAVLAQQHTPAGADPVKAMSMEDARKMGLARRVREVPEDFGVTDTTGAPPRTPPTIKYSIDPTMLKKAAPLPSELMKVESKEVQGAAARSQIITTMNKVATSVPAVPESASAFLNRTVQNGPSNSPVTSGPAMPRSVVRAHQQSAQPVPEAVEEEIAEEAEPEMVLEEEAQPGGEAPAGLPAPDLTELEQDQAPVQPTPPGEDPTPEANAEAPAAPPVKPAAKRDRFICPACGQPFKFYSQFENHAKAKHKAQSDALLQMVPKP